MSKAIYFDLDGTIANLYDVPNWLDRLRASDPAPYLEARPLVNLNVLARRLNALQRKGYKIGIISWLSKNSTSVYDAAVTQAKMKWLARHLRSVKWDNVYIVAYGTNKWDVCGAGILFDDEAKNRETWQEEAYEPANIMTVLKAL